MTTVRIWLLGCGICLAPVLVHASSGPEKRAQPPPSSSETALPSPAASASEDISSATPLARRFFALAHGRTIDRHDPPADEAAHRRKQAQTIAMEYALKKARERQGKDRAAKQQVQGARERELKALYQKGAWLYDQGFYQEAIKTLQQMALLDPTHPLVRTAERLITRVELKQMEQRARAKLSVAPGVAQANVADLTRLLTEKRIEQETTLKYANAALRERNYDTAIDLLYRVLNQDPSSIQAQQLLQQAQMAKLEAEETRLKRDITLDDQRMMNEVMRAELTKPTDLTGSRAVPLPMSQTSVTPITASWLDTPISFDFQDVGLGDVLDFVADAANVSIIPSPHLDLKEQRVSLKVDRLPLELALKYLVKNQGLSYRIDENAILVANSEEFENEPLETRVFLLRSGLGPFALETSAVESNSALQMESLKTLIEQAITQPSGSKIVVDERSGSLILTNTPENFRRVERLLSQLDTTPIQVLIEARFVEVTFTELEQQGFEALLNTNAILNKKEASDGTEGAANQVAKGGGFKFPSLSRETEGLNLTLQGILSQPQFESVWHALSESQKSKTLSSPRVTALNNQPAVIKVVDEFRYPTRYEVSLVQFDINGDGDFDDAGETEFVNVPKDFEKRDVGILLNVTPSVGQALKDITLVLAPEVSQFSQFRDLGGGVTVPEFTSSQLTTSVSLQDGQTVVLGGLMKDTTSVQLTKVPVLGDLPLFGGLFRKREDSQVRKNLLIFVTAHVLAPRGPTT
ncbi:MAG: hypothetical protein HYZ89_06245 [Candidatus Omnitrophica bacterium]|nr:hypothetical protein [Candidatus Omnitrophota bacterium]